MTPDIAPNIPEYSGTATVDPDKDDGTGVTDKEDSASGSPSVDADAEATTQNVSLSYAPPKHESLISDLRGEALNSGLYYPTDDEEIWGYVDGVAQKTDMGFGFETKDRSEFIIDGSTAGKTAEIYGSSAAGYPWAETQTRYVGYDSNGLTRIVEPKRGTLPTLLKARLRGYEDLLSIQYYYSRVAFGITVEGSRSGDVAGCIERDDSGLTVRWTDPSGTRSYSIRAEEDCFQDHVIPTRLIVRLQAAGGAGGYAGGGSGSCWLGVISLDEDHSRWEFSLGKPGDGGLDIQSQSERDASDSYLLCAPKSKSGLQLGQIDCYGGKGGTSRYAGGAGTGGATPKVTQGRTGTSVWPVASEAGSKGGLNGTYNDAGTQESAEAGEGRPAEDLYITSSSNAREKPRNSYHCDERLGGDCGRIPLGATYSYAITGGGGAASPSGNGGAGGWYNVSAKGGDGGRGAGGGGRSNYSDVYAGGSGGIATLELYY